MKICSKCKIKKPLTEYHNNSSKRDGKASACKECRNAYNREKSREIGYDVLYRRALERDPDKYKARAAKYYERNTEKVKARSREWREKNPEKKKQQRALHYQNNREQYIERAAKWAEENRGRRREISRDYAARFYNDPENRPVIIARKLLSRILGLTGKRKAARTEAALGYSVSELRSHLEKHFQEGMSWDNHGEWHVDHVIPVSEMVALGIECPKKINSLDNLRPIWAEENLKKGNRFILTPPLSG